jgi:hypothetical protein
MTTVQAVLKRAVSPKSLVTLLAKEVLALAVAVPTIVAGLGQIVPIPASAVAIVTAVATAVVHYLPVVEELLSKWFPSL